MNVGHGKDRIRQTVLEGGGLVDWWFGEWGTVVVQWLDSEICIGSRKGMVSVLRNLQSLFSDTHGGRSILLLINLDR